MRSAGIATVLALVLGTAGDAYASVADADSDAAEGIYQAAKAVYAKRHYRDAIDLFVEANRLRPSPALSYDIARCYEKLRDAPRALAWYRDYLHRSRAPRDAAQVKRRIASLEKRVPRKRAQPQSQSSAEVARAH